MGTVEHDQPPGPITIRVLVRWGDCDPAGIVHFPNFFAWMDLSSHALAREMGIPREDMVAPRLLGFPLVSAQADFLAPARMDDTIEVRSWVRRVGRTSLGLRHELIRLPDGVLLARGRDDRVHVEQNSTGTLHPRELSPAMRAVLERHRDPAATD